VSTYAFSQNDPLLYKEFELQIDYQFQGVGEFNTGLAPARKNGFWGFISSTGSVAIACEYQEVKPFSKGIAAVKTKNAWRLINTEGQFLTDDAYEVVAFSENYIKVKKDGMWGALNRDMDLVVPFEYTSFVFEGDGFIEVRNRDNLRAILNFKGDTIIPFRYVRIEWADGYFLCADREKNAYFLNESGESLDMGELKSSGTRNFKDGYAILANKKEEYKLIDKAKKVWMEGESYIEMGHGTLVAALKNEMMGIYDFQAKKWLVNPAYFWLKYEAGDIWQFSAGNSYGLINEKGEVVVEASSKSMIKSANNISVLERNHKKAYYSHLNGKLSDFDYDQIKSCDNGQIILVKQNDFWSVLNLKGKVILEKVRMHYDPVFSENLLAVQNEEGKWGFVRFIQ
jgi:hypothetical protein